MTSIPLKEEWATYKNANPHVRIRDAAHALGVSEAVLLATQVGESVTRLRNDWYEMLPEFEQLGEVMALTRNEVFVHEKVGKYSHASVNAGHQMGQTLNENIDLRIFFRNWHHGFAVSQRKDGALKYSLQFFDQFGDAVHKLHLRPDSNVDFFHSFAEKYRHADQTSNIDVEDERKATPLIPDDSVDVSALRDAWDALRDTHDFIFMLRKFRVSREQAFRLAGSDYARKIDPKCFQTALEHAAEASLKMMIFVNNPGCIQIHSGLIHRLKLTRDWYNILDPGFNLHVKYKDIASTWIVKKPVETGEVHSIECFDNKGNVLSYLFSKRKEGEHESEVWREILQPLA